MYVGIALCVLGLSKAHAIEYQYSWSGSSRALWSIGYIAVLALTAYGFGLPDQVRSWRSVLAAALGATIVAALCVSLAQLVLGGSLLPRFVVFGSVVVLVPWYMLCAAMAGDGRVRAGARDRVVVVADRDEVDDIERELARAPERPATIVAALSIEDARSTSVPPDRPLVTAGRAAAASVVVLSRAAQDDEDVVEQASTLHGLGVRVRTLSLFYEQWLGKLPLGELERVSLLFDIGEVHATRYAHLKRMLDVVLAFGGCVLLALVTPFVLAGNAIVNRGPLLYRQRRTGRNGTTFEMLKFRTMASAGAADDAVAGWTVADDARVTPFGRVMRRVHLDELPQVVNVLRGELSLVGPRPEQPELVKELDAKIPFYGIRHLVRPGLTGWAQVKYPYAASTAETLEKLQYEIFYLRRQSLGLDLRIVARTLRTVVGREGR
jgi:lipopolysaccharide/colanic/teichoic acid biosynthesis glycosyltransferase